MVSVRCCSANPASVVQPCATMHTSFHQSPGTGDFQSVGEPAPVHGPSVTSSGMTAFTAGLEVYIPWHHLVHRYRCGGAHISQPHKCRVCKRSRAPLRVGNTFCVVCSDDIPHSCTACANGNSTHRVGCMGHGVPYQMHKPRSFTLCHVTSMVKPIVE